jgi:hypothetical protein
MSERKKDELPVDHNRDGVGRSGIPEVHGTASTGGICVIKNGVPNSHPNNAKMHSQDDDPSCKPRRHVHHRGEGGVMDNQVPKYVTRARASLLLGITEAELSRISKESGSGRVERIGNQEETYFTYEELLQICVVATNRMRAAH